MDYYILDLDGTMMPSHDVDNECYWRAVRAVFGAPAATPDLSRFENVTDAGILAQWARETLGRPVTTRETREVKTHFLEMLRSAAGGRRAEFQPMPGLEAWLSGLRDGGRLAAIATGGWRHTARFKLEVSRLARFDLPLASSDDAESRTGIMAIALNRVSAPRGTALRGTVTYVGDGPWDARSARKLGWDFIGIADGDRAAALRASGATRVYGDFLELLDD